MSNDDWAAALAEAENPAVRDAGLWAKCFAEADGDEAKAMAAYVRAKVAPAPAPPHAPKPPGKILGYCPSCNYELSMNAEACPNCKALFGNDGWKPTLTPQGNPNNNRFAQSTAPEAPKSGGVWKWVVGVPVGLVVAFLGFGAFVGNSPEGNARAAERDAIKFCWQEQSRKSLDPSTARFAASACERMEENYRKQWGRNP